MAIQNRRGVFSDLDPTKLLPGEYAVVISGDPDNTDGNGVYICFAPGQVKKIALTEDMSLDGKVYPDLTAGELFADTYAENKTPYFFRTSGGGAEVGTLEAPVITGGSVGWNQLANGIWQITGGTKTENADGSCTFTASASGQQVYNSDINAIASHKYLASVDFKTTSATADVGLRTFGINYYGTSTTDWQTRNTIYNCTYSSGVSIGVVDSRSSGWDAIDVKNFKFIDLTLLLGSTIANRIYTLEQSTAGSGIAQLKAWGFDFDEYVPYTAPTLKHVEGVSEHRFVGFNQWDEEWENAYWNVSGNKVSSANYVCSKSKIRIINGAIYYLKFPVAMTIRLYDGNGNVLGTAPGTWKDETFNPKTYQPNAEYMTFHSASSGALTTYNHDICINTSNSAKNGTYEPYRTWSYALDGGVTLRGVPKHDASNQLYYDGDTYEPDGTVTRKYAIRAYQSGDESLADAITDGTDTLYKLSTPTAETATPFAEYQEVDANGTEEYVSTGVVPVGHVTKYPTDLKGTLETILSAIPSANGTYALKVTVNNGKHTFSWV